jgi:hypothetical protein
MRFALQVLKFPAMKGGETFDLSFLGHADKVIEELCLTMTCFLLKVPEAQERYFYNLRRNLEPI